MTYLLYYRHSVWLLKDGKEISYVCNFILTNSLKTMNTYCMGCSHQLCPWCFDNQCLRASMYLPTYTPGSAAQCLFTFENVFSYSAQRWNTALTQYANVSLFIIKSTITYHSNFLSLILSGCESKTEGRCAVRQILFYIHACIYAQLQMITENNIIIEARVERPFISITQMQVSLCEWSLEGLPAWDRPSKTCRGSCS